MFVSNTKFDTLPTIQSYEGAVRLFEKTVPMRGTSIIPLGDRKYNKQMRMERDPHGIDFILYNTPCVRVTDDNVFHLTTGGWHSQSTAKFIHRLLPSWGSAYMRNGHVVFFNRRNIGEYVVPGRGEDSLRITGEGQVLNPPQNHTWRINRSKANEMRKPYGPFLKFVKGWCKLMFDGNGLVGMAQVFGEDSHMKTLMGQMSVVARIPTAQPEEYADILKDMLSHSRWWSATTAQKEVMEQINRFHSREILERVELPVGVLPKSTPYDSVMWLKPDC